MNHLYTALNNIKTAIGELSLEYGYDRYTALLAHVKNELEKDILTQERAENQLDLANTYPMTKGDC